MLEGVEGVELSRVELERTREGERVEADVGTPVERGDHPVDYKSRMMVVMVDDVCGKSKRSELRDL